MFAHAGKIEGLEWQENKETLACVAVSRLFSDLSFPGPGNSVYLADSPTVAQGLFLLCIVRLPPRPYDLTHDNNLTAEIKLLLRLSAM